MQKASKAGIPRIFCHYKGVKLWMFAFCSGHSLNWWKTKYHHESAICPLLGVKHCRYFGLSLHVCLELTLRYVENLVSMCVFLCVREREREREREMKGFVYKHFILFENVLLWKCNSEQIKRKLLQQLVKK